MRATASRSLQSDINVTPLVDVCLVLLIIFMVVVPAMVNGEDVQLPSTSSTKNVDERILPLTVKEDGSVYIDTLVIRRDEVRSALTKLRTTDASRPIAIRADKRVQYGEVLSVLADCRHAGWEDVTLVGMREEGSGVE
ncbi:MAG TPA: biopolymer transporter ExbD [Thermoanaerobaculia bacterium]|jgi:biopolymer transport protein ExbD|nr:biopolymer transporter ExbD [Thermoanaerobaculia bacterium]